MALGTGPVPGRDLGSDVWTVTQMLAPVGDSGPPGGGSSRTCQREPQPSHLSRLRRAPGPVGCTVSIEDAALRGSRVHPLHLLPGLGGPWAASGAQRSGVMGCHRETAPSAPATAEDTETQSVRRREAAGLRADLRGSGFKVRALPALPLSVRVSRQQVEAGWHEGHTPAPSRSGQRTPTKGTASPRPSVPPGCPPTQAAKRGFSALPGPQRKQTGSMVFTPHVVPHAHPHRSAQTPGFSSKDVGSVMFAH